MDEEDDEKMMAATPREPRKGSTASKISKKWVFPDGAKISDKEINRSQESVPVGFGRPIGLGNRHLRVVDGIGRHCHLANTAKRGRTPDPENRTERPGRGSGLGGRTIDDLAELTEVRIGIITIFLMNYFFRNLEKSKTLPLSFSGEMIEYQLTTPVPVQFSQPAAKRFHLFFFRKKIEQKYF